MLSKKSRNTRWFRRRKRCKKEESKQKANQDLRKAESTVTHQDSLSLGSCEEPTSPIMSPVQHDQPSSLQSMQTISSEANTGGNETIGLDQISVSAWPGRDSILSTVGPEKNTENSAVYDAASVFLNSPQEITSSPMTLPQVQPGTAELLQTKAATVNSNEGVTNTTVTLTVITATEATSTVSSEHNSTLTENVCNFEAQLPTTNILGELCKTVQAFVPQLWICHVEAGEELHLSLLSSARPAVIQRTISYISASGHVGIAVHGKLLPAEHPVYSSFPNVPALTNKNIKMVANCLNIIFCQVRQFEICIGANHEELAPLWKKAKNTHVDDNNFKEMRYNRCCRSNQCVMLISIRSHRCSFCKGLSKALHKRNTRNKDNAKGTPLKFKPDIHLTTPESKARARRRVKNNRNLNMQVNRLRQKIDKVISNHGVDVNKQLSDDLESILSQANLTEFQKLFFRQCLKNSAAKSPCGHRWHPAIVRFALDIQLHSPSTYNVMKRYLVLPSERTLFDYSHVETAREGVCLSTVEEMSAKLSEMEDYQRFHLISYDEVYISKNLVHKKETGEIVGYCNLSDVEKELTELEQVLQSTESSPIIDETPPIASKILSFMAVGASSGLREVVASYRTNSLDADNLYDKHWEVVEVLECAGVKCLGSIGDGCQVNRAFIEKHPPLTKTKPGVVFDTVNPYGENRPFFFFSDPPHLLKTIRNCFASSSRNLKRNNAEIKWSHIIRLYNATKDKTLRKAFHLNADSVFLTSYSRMSVSHAARVMSTTVANALRQTGWDDVKETADFLERVCHFFQCLNGNYCFEGARKRNDDLKPYTEKDDPRFKVLEEFVLYLEDWSDEVGKLPITSEQKEKMQLSRQTLQGIQITVRSFIAAVRYLLDAGTKFIMARVFCQDLLEHYFGRQRAKCGGSTNPNSEEFFRHQNTFKVLGAVGAKRNRSNVDVDDSGPSVESTPLKKRPKSAKRSLF